MTVAQDFHLKLPAETQLVALFQQFGQPVAGKLDRHAPTHHALAVQQAQGVGVVAIQRVTGNKWQAALGRHVHGA
ncbi:hypothetical protein D3C81_1798370 [compost metagenome]